MFARLMVLKVISASDLHRMVQDQSAVVKDYDEVEVKVKSASLTNISPNPSSDQITVSYDPQQVTSAYLMVNMPYTGNTNNYILDLNNMQIQIDISAYPPGVYGVILVAYGQMVDELGLVVN